MTIPPQGRIESANDLPATRARYSRPCQCSKRTSVPNSKGVSRSTKMVVVNSSCIIDHGNSCTSAAPAYAAPAQARRPHERGLGAIEVEPHRWDLVEHRLGKPEHSGSSDAAQDRHALGQAGAQGFRRRTAASGHADGP